VTARSRWLACRAPRPRASARLYCFPHAGGSAGEYAAWADDLPDVEVAAIQLPGRGGRLEEPPLEDAAAVRAAVLAGVAFRAPFALFGHSLGALLAYEVARGLEARGAGPACLVVSASRAPSTQRRLAPISHLDAAALLAELADGHDPSIREVLGDPEIQELVLPGLRADLRLAEQYAHAHGPPLRCPIIALGGDGDDITRDDLVAWQAHAAGPFSVHLIPGGHFFTRTARDAVARLLAALIREFAQGSSP
jgi:surfactin synthase thioesterase subunit